MLRLKRSWQQPLMKKTRLLDVGLPRNYGGARHGSDADRPSPDGHSTARLRSTNGHSTTRVWDSADAGSSRVSAELSLGTPNPPEARAATRRLHVRHAKAGRNPHPERAPGLFVSLKYPCHACKIKTPCPVDIQETQVPETCMSHLMQQGVTWACAYNVNSWCTYVSSTHTCYAQDDAPNGDHHKLALEHRSRELAFFETTRPGAKLKRKAQERLATWQQSRSNLLTAVMPQRLTLCRYYKDYAWKTLDSQLNPIDQEIPRLVALGTLCTKSFPV